MEREKEAIQKRVDHWKAREVEAVINSSPSIYLARTGCLDFLSVYSKVYMPQNVKTEVVDAGKKVKAPDALFLEKAIEEDKIIVAKPKSKKTYNMLLNNPLIHEADCQAIALADERGSVLIMDDSKGIEIAKMLNLVVEPTLTVIFIAYALGISDYPRTKEILETLLTTSFRISAKEYNKALRYLDLLRAAVE